MYNLIFSALFTLKRLIFSALFTLLSLPILGPPTLNLNSKPYSLVPSNFTIYLNPKL